MIGVVFVVHAKSATINNNRTALSYILYKRTFSRDSNVIKKVQIVFHSVEKNQCEIFDFWSYFKLVIKVVSNCNSLIKLNLGR